VFDVSSQQSFDSLQSWLNEMKKEIGDPTDMDKVVFVVCANKVYSISFLYVCMAIKHIIVLFVETPRKFITAKLLIRKPGSSPVYY
jgi:hypothetical protein